MLFCLAMVLVGIFVAELWHSIPPAWNPWEPLSLTHSMNPVTRWKLSRLKSSPDQCLTVLASAHEDSVDYLPLKDYTPVESCPLTNVVRVRSTGVNFNSPFTLTCPLLVRWLMFEQQKLQPLALEHLHSKVTTIEHYGTFACRNLYGREIGDRSQHATASAFDVAEFRLENGVVVNILRDWNNQHAPASRAFLHDVHHSACDYFGTALGPDYNQPHANHFHLDTSNYGLCR